MMLKLFTTIADTLSQKPEVGVFGGMLGVALSPIMIISLISATLGLFIAIITLIIKMMDMRDKIRKKKRLLRDKKRYGITEDNCDFIIIGDRRYKFDDIIDG